MSACSGCAAEIGCSEDQDTLFPYSLTPGTPFPYVITCPDGQNCSAAVTITMNCCGTPVTADIPQGATTAERASIVQSLVSRCAFIERGCSNPPANPPPGTPDDPNIPPGSQLYYSRFRRVTSSCSSAYGGGTYEIEVVAGQFVGRTQQEADSLAAIFAAATVVAQRFCLNAPCLCPCADEATTLNINTVGGTGPFSFEITSGTLPTGLTMAVVGGVLRVTGTPTVPGNSTITVKVYDSLGGYLTKSLTFYVIEITTTTLPNFQTGVEYSEQLTVSGGVGPFAWSILDGSGDLPDGLTLSDEGLISGTPTGTDDATFTVVAVDTGITGHQGCEKELDLNWEPSEEPGAWAVKGGVYGVEYAYAGIVTTFNPPDFVYEPGSGYTSLPNPGVNFLYQYAIPAVTYTPYTPAGYQIDFGDGETYVFTVLSGDLNGLAVSSGGVISGTPTKVPPWSTLPIDTSGILDPSDPGWDDSMYYDDWRRHKRIGGGSSGPLTFKPVHQITFVVNAAGAGPSAGDYTISIPLYVTKLTPSGTYTPASGIATSATIPVRMEEGAGTGIPATPMPVGPNIAFQGFSGTSGSNGFFIGSVSHVEDQGWQVLVSIYAQTVPFDDDGIPVSPDAAHPVILSYASGYYQDLGSTFVLTCTVVTFRDGFWAPSTPAELEAIFPDLVLGDATLEMTFTAP